MTFSNLNRFLQKILLCALHVYSDYISYFFPSTCRFYPSCSHYAKEAIKKYGAILGVFYSLHRVLRCHPWHKGGHDPVPEQKCASSTTQCAIHDHSQTLNLIED